VNLANNHPQRRTVECRKTNDDRLFLVHGFVRTAAARLIRSGFKYIDPETQAEVTVKNKRYKLWVSISEAEGAL
jgi:hypothetical protein